MTPPIYFLIGSVTAVMIMFFGGLFFWKDELDKGTTVIAAVCTILIWPLTYTLVALYLIGQGGAWVRKRIREEMEE